MQELQDTDQLIGVTVQTLDVRGPDDFDAAFDAAAGQHLDGPMVLDDPLTFAYRARIVEFAETNGLLANYDRREWAEAGGIIPNSIYSQATAFIGEPTCDALSAHSLTAQVH